MTESITDEASLDLRVCLGWFAVEDSQSGGGKCGVDGRKRTP